jgi:FkbM family methyltransferase
MQLLLILLEKVWGIAESRGMKTKNRFASNYMHFASRHIQSFWKKFPSKNGDFSRSIYGVHLKDRFPDKTYGFCINGDYGFFLADKLRKIESPMVFMDIGANIGLFSLLAAKNRNIKRILSFEPDPSSLVYLRANLEFNKSKDIDIFPYAVSENAGPCFLKVTEGHSGISTLTEVALDSENYEAVWAVDWEFLNEVTSGEIYSSFFIKIDVEGHEKSVLECLIKWQYFERIQAFFIEFDTFLSDVPELTRILLEHGFVERERVGTENHWDSFWTKKH